MSHSHLLDTAIGGLIALLGTGIAQWFGFFSSQLERKQKHGELQRERLQKIADGVADGFKWMYSIHLPQSFDSVRDSSPYLSVRPSMVLCRIYFHDLIPYAFAFLKSLTDYHLFVLQSYDPDNKSTLPILAKMSIYNQTKWRELSEAVSSSAALFDEAIEREARKHDPSA
jgi:hypothetical protein